MDIRGRPSGADDPRYTLNPIRPPGPSKDLVDIPPIKSAAALKRLDLAGIDPHNCGRYPILREKELQKCRG
jgi:hypothetical protein